MNFHVRPLSENLAFGSIVTDLDMSTLEDPAVRQALVALWVDRGLVVFQGLATDEAGHIALSSVFGTPEIHPLRDPSKPGRPELSDIRYDSVFGEVYEFADGSRRGGWLPWHFDLVYVDRINHGGNSPADRGAREWGRNRIHRSDCGVRHPGRSSQGRRSTSSRWFIALTSMPPTNVLVLFLG